jgi:HlyD family type I secretion membrane fusion protein
MAEVQVQSQQTGPKTFPAILFGGLTVLLFVGGLTAWSTLAPLESAALAPGYVSIEMSRKTLSHLEGGIIRTIHVREGEQVKRGQTLITLEATKASASLALRRGRHLALAARAARLIAETSDQKTIAFPKLLHSRAGEPQIREILDGEIAIFETHKKTLQSQTSILKQQNTQFAALIAGLRKGIQAQDKQLRVLREEIKLYQYLLKRGLTQKPRVLELQGREAEIEGRRSQNEGEIARTKQRMGETELRISDLHTESRNKAAEELRTIQTELVGLGSQILAAEDILNRTVIVAPIDGTVIALREFTAGGVIGPGKPIMHIVPTNDRLLVDARVNPRDIDVVSAGLLAKVHLTAFQRRHVRPLEGRVLSVSADRLIEDRTGEAYYLVRIELTESPGDVLDGAVLQPGMAAEVMIVTGARSAMEYLLEPLTRSLNAAFRES